MPEKFRAEDEVFEEYFGKFRNEIRSRPQNTLKSRIEDGWVTVRIFCSSTFKDQLVERSVLKSYVIPALEVWARERFIEIVMVDLSWGILEGSSAETTVRTCLEEISNCEKLNGSPYFLFLGGQRYGWAPSVEEVGSSICSTYKWIDGASVTAMEVLHGALRSGNENSIFCLRDPKFLEAIPESIKSDFMENNSMFAVKQRALLESIIASQPTHLFAYNPLEPVGDDPLFAALLSSDSLEKSVGGTYGGNWVKFASTVLDRLKSLISRQYPVVETFVPGSLESMRKQQRLFMQTLSEHAIPRVRFLSMIHDSVLESLNDANSRGTLLVLGGPSGRGKSSAMSLIAQKLEEDKGIQVIYHFVGSSDRSDELSTTARRIVSELKLAWGESVDDTAIADGDTEACALARQTILRGPMSSRIELKQDLDPLMSAKEEKRVVLFIDAVNQLRCESEHILDWLPEEEDIASLPKGLVIVVSCTPGPELESLVRRAEKCNLKCDDGDNPTSIRAFEIPSLDYEDKKNIASGLLSRYTKLFSESQMRSYLEIPGSSNPLWQNVAMFYLRKYATFESLSALISTLPSNVDSLIDICLSKAETIIGRIYVMSFLLGVCLTRQGLWESEALQLLPILVKQLSDDDKVAAEPPQEVNMFIWSHLRSSLDVFLHQNVVGTQAVLAPSHNIVRDAIIHRYTADNHDNSEIVLRVLANFFHGSSTVHQSRKFLEASWAFLCLRDYSALSEFLRTPEVMLHQWRFSGDSGRWGLIKLWKDVEELRAQSTVLNSETETGEIDNLVEDTTSVSVQEITEWASGLTDSLVKESGELSNQTFVILRAIYDLLDSMRRSNASLNFLKVMEDLLVDQGNQSDMAVQICLAWIHYSIGNCLNDRGDYCQAAAKIEQALAEFEAIPDVHPHRCVANLYLSLGKIYDELKRYDEALSVFNKAEVTYKAVSLAIETNQSISPIVAMLMDEYNGSSSSLKTELATAEADVAKEIANVMFSLERFDDAMEYYTKAFIILRRHLGENHPKTARAMWGFGIVQKMKEDFYGSIETYEKVLNIFMIALGPHHPDTADMSYNIATSYSDLKQYDIALSHYIAAIKVYIKVYGERHRDVAFTWNDIGSNELSAGRLNAAISAFETALSIREEIFGPDDECTLATKTLLEKALDQQALSESPT